MTSARVRLRALEYGATILAVAGAANCARSVPPTAVVRNGHGLAYDGRITLLFGGADERQVLADTWGWDGVAWRRFDVAGPDARTFPVMTAAENGVYLFGGRRVLFGASLELGQLLGDLWHWDGVRWQRIHADGPAPRAEASGAWDPSRRRLVVFGGYSTTNGAVDRLGDTWEFGDGRWMRVAGDGPDPRHGAAMAYDPESREVVLFGGNGARSDSWAWNGERWRRLDAGSVPGRFNAVAVTAEWPRALVRFGGWDGRQRSNDTSTLASLTWRPLAGLAPSPRNHSGLAYDRRRQQVVLVGGHDGERVFGDVWEMGERGWHRVLDVVPRSRVGNGH